MKTVSSLFFLCLLIPTFVMSQEYTTSITGTDFDFIKDGDPSCFQSLNFERFGNAEMPDKTDDSHLFKNAFIFTASYEDSTKIQIAVDSDFKTEEAAKLDALRYATRIGKLPTVLRKGVKRLVVHYGQEDTTAFSDHGLIVVYSANATKRISTHDLEETLFHESVHAAWDRKYAKSKDWARAQASDGAFISIYAKKKPLLEDLAESALFAYVLVHHPERIPNDHRKRIAKAIPARIRFVEKLIPKDRPIFFDVGMLACDVDLAKTGIAMDIISHTLAVDYGYSDEKVSEVLENLGEELLKAVAAKAGLDEQELRSKVNKNKHVNCEHNAPK